MIENIDISRYTDIVDIGYTYVSDEFAWESAGLACNMKGLNENEKNNIFSYYGMFY